MSGYVDMCGKGIKYKIIAVLFYTVGHRRLRAKLSEYFNMKID